MKIRARTHIRSSSGNRQRLAALAAPAAILVRKQLEASRKKAREGVVWDWYLFFANFFAAQGKTLLTCLVMAASTWPEIGTGASLQEIAKRSDRVRTEEIRLNHLDVQHQYSLLYSISALESLGPDARVTVEIVQGEGCPRRHTTLHAGDADLYAISHAENGDAGRSGPDVRLREATVTGQSVAADPTGEEWTQPRLAACHLHPAG
jgi:hypothetical protein